MGKDLYSILGVAKTATKAEIKTAYHKLARKYHPDVNKDNPQAAEKFKEVSAAYDILGDDDKRKKYDNNEIDADGKPTGFGAGFGGAYSGSAGGNPFGQGGFYSSSSGRQNANFDFSSIFGDDIFSAFGGGTQGAYQGFGTSNRRARKGEDINYTMSIDFLTAVKGGERQVSLGGRNVNVKIPSGTVDGQTLRLKGLGNPGHFGGENGDVLITLNVDKHPYFNMEGQNITMELPISVKEAILGGKVTVPTIDGQVMVKIPAYASSGDKLRLKGKGIKNRNGVGDQLISLKIVAPRSKNADLEKVLQTMPDENIRTF